MASLTLVIPAYNEARRLPATLRTVAAFIPGGPYDPVEVIVVDDGSTDGTAECAAELADIVELPAAEFRVLRNGRNRGKGHSVRRGMREAQHDWVLFSDADLSAPLEDVELLKRAAETGPFDIAIGSRGLDRSLIGERQPPYREFAGRLFNRNVRLLLGLDFADTQCGFKLFSREAARQVAEKQRIERFGFDVEQLYIARELGLSVAEVPVRWNNAEGSSVGALDGMGAFLDVWTVMLNGLIGRYR